MGSSNMNMKSVLGGVVGLFFLSAVLFGTCSHGTASFAAALPDRSRHGGSSNSIASGGIRVRHSESTFEQDPATYDDACNIGFCAIMGATIGGWGAEPKVVSTLGEFASLVGGSEPAVVVVQGVISGNYSGSSGSGSGSGSGTTSTSSRLVVGSGKTIIGAPGSAINGVELFLSGSRNVIVRNLKISSSKPAQLEGSAAAAVTLENARSIWIDHVEFSPGSKLNITQGSDYVSVTNNLFQGGDHTDAVPAASVGHADDSAAQDEGNLLHVTFGRNYFRNVKNAVTFRFGTGHLFNEFYENFEEGINTQRGARVLVEATAFEGSSGNGSGGSGGSGGGGGGGSTPSKAVLSSDSAGFATLKDVVLLGESTVTAPAGDMTAESLPYPYDWYILDKETVKAAATRYAGQTLEFLAWE